MSGLFDELAAHISGQKDSLELLNNLTVEATNFVQKGNIQLVRATKRTVDFRLMVCISSEGVKRRNGLITINRYCYF